MATQDVMRLQIRDAVGTKENVFDTAPLAKETLTNVAEAVEADVDTDPESGSTNADLRAAIVNAIGFTRGSTAEDYPNPYPKRELERIRDAVADGE